MKPSPQLDFSVSVRDQVLEVEPPAAQLYQGIYDVTLNFSVRITFVPIVEASIKATMIILPEDIDSPTTEQEARRVAVATTSYAVLPDAACAGQEQHVVLPSRLPASAWYSSSPTIIFYVQPAEFAVFAEELAVLADEMPSIRDSRPVSELQDLACIQFIETRILPSQNFDSYDAYMLGR